MIEENASKLLKIIQEAGCYDSIVFRKPKKDEKFKNLQ